MYFHKEGSEYFKAIFGHIWVIIQQKYSNNGNSELSVQNFKKIDDYDTSEILKKLLGYVNDITEHIKKETAVLSFIKKLHIRAIGDSTNNSELAQISTSLSRAHNALADINKNFENLKQHVIKSLQLLEDTNSMKGNVLIAEFININETLKVIHSDSESIAQNIKNILKIIKAEEEMIIQEKAAVTDFEKNFMSWLQ